ncbi:MAG TPA: hypothetical protein VG815_15955 [Chloroflexota bacterium]|nr:hypothetical protein [Chloroflexota bacterium]
MFELQQAEGLVETENAAIHALERQLRGDPEIDATRRRIESLATEQSAARTALRTLERQADDLTATIKRHTDTLYGGQIHDTRELNSIEAEIGHARVRQSALEDREIELMEKLDTLDASIAAAQEKLDSLVESRGAGLSGLESQLNAHRERLAVAEAERQALAAVIQRPLLAQYERLRDRLGHGVSPIEEGICHWCRVQAPAKDVQHARGDTIVTCGNCGRILFAE